MIHSVLGELEIRYPRVVIDAVAVAIPVAATALGRAALDDFLGARAPVDHRSRGVVSLCGALVETVSSSGIVITFSRFIRTSCMYRAGRASINRYQGVRSIRSRQDWRGGGEGEQRKNAGECLYFKHFGRQL